MDLRLLDAEPTVVERDAVDAFLGPSLAIWTGTDAIENGHAAHGGHAARSQRHLLLPTLHALHERAGWISPGGLNYVAKRLTVPPADVYGVATFYALFSVDERPPRVVTGSPARRWRRRPRDGRGPRRRACRCGSRSP